MRQEMMGFGDAPFWYQLTLLPSKSYPHLIAVRGVATFK